MSDSFISRTIEDNVACRQLISGYLTEVTESMLYGLTEIKDYAFYGLAYGRSIKIPNNITSIGNYAFYNFGVARSSSGIYFDLIIPNSVTNIGDSAFGSSGLASVIIPNSVISIGQGVFSSTLLESVIIPNSVTNIGAGVFNNAQRLENVTVEADIPPTIGYGAFTQTSSNLKIYVPAASVEAYKTATNWSTYADKIQAIPSE